MNTWGTMEVIPSFSVISLGGAPDLRARCVFGQRLRLNGYYPFEGSIVVVVYFALALVQALRWGRILRPTSESASLLKHVRRRSLPRSGPLEAATVQTPPVGCYQARARPGLCCHSKEARASPDGAVCWADGTSATSAVLTSRPPNTRFAHRR